MQPNYPSKARLDEFTAFMEDVDICIKRRTGYGPGHGMTLEDISDDVPFWEMFENDFSADAAAFDALNVDDWDNYEF